MKYQSVGPASGEWDNKFENKGEKRKKKKEKTFSNSPMGVI